MHLKENPLCMVQKVGRERLKVMLGMLVANSIVSQNNCKEQDTVG
jgi:hypothetical protein